MVSEVRRPEPVMREQRKPPRSSLEADRWAEAVRHLRKVDPWLRAVIKRIGPCLLTPRADRFGALVNSIVAQQISAKAATAINQRLHALGGQPHRPERLMTLG